MEGIRFMFEPSPHICTELSVVKNLNTDQPVRALTHSDSDRPVHRIVTI
jgi:hypothetical protein